LAFFFRILPAFACWFLRRTLSHLTSHISHHSLIHPFKSFTHTHNILAIYVYIHTGSCSSMGSSSSTHTASCRCGQTEFELTGEPVITSNCACNDCVTAGHYIDNKAREANIQNLSIIEVLPSPTHSLIHCITSPLASLHSCLTALRFHSPTHSPTHSLILAYCALCFISLAWQSAVCHHDDLAIIGNQNSKGKGKHGIFQASYQKPYSAMLHEVLLYACCGHSWCKVRIFYLIYKRGFSCAQ
jgi:hypothetical protein